MIVVVMSPKKDSFLYLKKKKKLQIFVKYCHRFSNTNKTLAFKTVSQK